MSGHSKWATIKRKKGAADAKRGKLFTQLIREISMAANLGGGDPDANPRLRLAMQKARGVNMPKDNIERAIKKGTGELEGNQIEEIRYEGYGPGGVAVIADTLTDNRNRTVGELRFIFSRFSGNLGTNGCVAYMFDRRGVLEFDRGSVDADALMEAAIEANALDIVDEQEALLAYAHKHIRVHTPIRVRIPQERVVTGQKKPSEPAPRDRCTVITFELMWMPSMPPCSNRRRASSSGGRSPSTTWSAR